MPIDWFTVAAQAFNFLVLVGLLRHFLYGPVTRAMAERRRAAAARQEEADRHLEEARRREQELAGQQRALEEERLGRLEQARREADERRDELLEQARREVDEQRAAWQDELERRREALLEEVGRMAARGVVEAARHALADLADDDLHGRAADVFLRRLEGLDDEQRDELAGAGDGAPRLRVGGRLDADREERLSAAVRELLGRDVEPEVDADLLWGVELTVGGVRLAWSVRSHLADLERELLAELAPGGVAAGEREDAGGS